MPLFGQRAFKDECGCTNARNSLSQVELEHSFIDWDGTSPAKQVVDRFRLRRVNQVRIDGSSR